jgi:PAS domain S-box-containing protein
MRAEPARWPARLRSALTGTLRRQFILGVALVQAVLMTGFIWDFSQRQRALLLEDRVAAAEALTVSLGGSAAGWILARDVAGLREIVAAMQGYPDLAFVMILGRDGDVLAHSEAARLGQRVSDLPTSVQPALLARSPRLVDAAAPVHLGGQHVGWVRVGLAPGPATRARLAQATRDGVLYAGVTIALGSLLAAWVASRLTRRLAVVRGVADAVERGETGRRAALVGTDEAARVAQALDPMLDAQEVAQQTLADSAQRLHMALDAAAMYAWRWEIGAERVVWGDDPAPLLGPRPAAGYADFREMVVPEDRAAFLAAGRAAAGGGNYEVEFRLRRTDGLVHWLVARGRVVPGVAGGSRYMIGVTRDITERKRAEQHLRDSEARANQIIDASPDALLTVAGDGRILRVNQRVGRMFGYDAAELLGQSVDALVPTRLRAGHPHKRDAFFGQPPSQGVVRLTDVHAQRKDGSEFPVQISLATMGAGPDRQVIVVVRDETLDRALQANLAHYRDHLEELVASRTADLTAARNEADRLARVKSEFLSNMSHEIRTPMNTIVSLNHLLRRDGATPEQVQKLDKIDSASQHLLALLGDILDLSKIDAGQMRLEDISFRLAAILGAVQSIIGEAARAKGLAVEIDTDAVPDWLCGDPMRLRQGLVNLASNAVKFTQHGKIVLRAELQEERGDQLLVRFSVQDSGIGISAEQQSHLFQAFEQTDASITRKYGGTGLGLAITQRLAQLMGGRAGVESALGAGSTFWFTALLRRSTGEPALATLAPTAQAETLLRQRHAGARILLAEDNEVNREIVCAMLQGVGLRADTAANGLEAVQMALDGAYDLVLMDMQMPVMSGLDAARELRALPGWQTTPILALTANAFVEDRRACAAAGMNDFITKPMEAGLFYATLLRWLDQTAPAVPTGVQLGPDGAAP